jgi:hypothetical protein
MILLELLDRHFKREMDIEKFVENVNKASDLANKTGVAVEKLPDHIQEMERGTIFCDNGPNVKNG